MFRPKVSRHALARAFVNGAVHVDAQSRPYELPILSKPAPVEPPAPSFDARPFALCARIFAVVMLVAMGSHSPQPLSLRVVSWAWEVPPKSATASVSCISVSGVSPVTIASILLALCIFDDACAFAWRGFGASAAVRHAAVLYTACAFAGVTDPSTLLLACVASACWPSMDYDAPVAVVAWIAAWAVPVVSLFGGAHADQTALCFILSEWALMLVDAASPSSGSRRRDARGILAELLVVAWFLGPGKFYKTVSVSC